MKGHLRTMFSLAFILVLVILLSRCMDIAARLPDDLRGPDYAGAKTCISCHKNVSVSYAHNSHALTSNPIGNNNLLNHPNAGSNTFKYNSHQQVVVEKRKNGFFQVAYQGAQVIRSEKTDISFGSGEKAYTYGYWKGNQLFELPLSYFSSINNWAISPGFPQNTFHYNRKITSRCIDCHGSFVLKLNPDSDAFIADEEMARGSLIYGIDCERCHGPSRQHVVFHLENPQEKKAKFITVFKTLTRKQKMDACAVCHAGNNLTVQKSVFNFKPGDQLEDYYEQDFEGFGNSNPDVHGNQSSMLMASKCYTGSKSMTCQSCHQTHENIKGNLKLYAQRCLSCHQSIRHSNVTLSRGSLTANCIDCHMPLESSKLISFKEAGKNNLSPYRLRSHRIAIYP